MTKQKLQALRKDIIDALNAVSEKHGVTITGGNGTYCDDSATLKLDIADVIDGTAHTKAELDFKRVAHLYGLGPEDFGFTFEYGGSAYTVSGINTRAKTYPVQACTSDGKRYKFPVSVIKSAKVAR